MTEYKVFSRDLYVFDAENDSVSVILESNKSNKTYNIHLFHNDKMELNYIKTKCNIVAHKFILLILYCWYNGIDDENLQETENIKDKIREQIYNIILSEPYIFEYNYDQLVDLFKIKIYNEQNLNKLIDDFKLEAEDNNKEIRDLINYINYELKDEDEMKIDDSEIEKLLFNKTKAFIIDYCKNCALIIELINKDYIKILKNNYKMSRASKKFLLDEIESLTGVRDSKIIRSREINLSYVDITFNGIMNEKEFKILKSRDNKEYNDIFMKYIMNYEF